MDGELVEPDAGPISTVLARLGVAEVRAFGLAWDRTSCDAPSFTPDLLPFSQNR